MLIKNEWRQVLCTDNYTYTHLGYGQTPRNIDNSGHLERDTCSEMQAERARAHGINKSLASSGKFRRITIKFGLLE